MKTSPSSRRRFLRQSTALTAGALAFPQIVRASTLGLHGRTSPNSKINLAVIGCGQRSTGGTQGYVSDDRVRLAAFCDPYDVNRILYKHKLITSVGADCSAPDFDDFREVLRLPEIDAVHISTPDHWHIPIALAAARAGKDIYCEKPLGLCVQECLAAQAISTRHGRVFQYGTQNRSMVQVRLGLQAALNGHIGQIKSAVVWAPKGISGYQPGPVLPIPRGLNYDLWQGPAPDRPFCHDRFFLTGADKAIFHVYDYAIGFIAGWGAHPIDQLQWWADLAGLGIPVRYEGTGQLPAKGFFNTLTHWDVRCTYANGLPLRFMDDATYQALQDPEIPRCQSYHGTLLLGEEGWICVWRDGWAFSSDDIRRRVNLPGPVVLRESRDHCRDFIDAILAREEPVSNLGAAIRSDLICHLSDIAIRTGRVIRWDPIQQTILDDPAARQMMSRQHRPPYGLDLTV